MITSRIKNIMESKGMTYAGLERLTGLSSQTVTRARSPRIREMTLGTLSVIADALDVNIKDLFDEIVPRSGSTAPKPSNRKWLENISRCRKAGTRRRAVQGYGHSARDEAAHSVEP